MADSTWDLRGETVLVVGRGSGIAKAVALAARDAGAAIALVKFLSGPDARPVIKAKGMETLSP